MEWGLRPCLEVLEDKVIAVTLEWFLDHLYRLLTHWDIKLEILGL